MSGLIPAAIASATTRFIAIFDEGLRRASPAYLSFVEEMPSTGKTNTYDWMPLGIQTREWKGSRHYSIDKVYEYSISNRKWETSLAVPIDAFEDAKAAGLGMYESRTRQMAQSASQHPQRLFAEVLNGGFTVTGPDGVTFFNTAHPAADGVTGSRSNRLPSNEALSAANFEVALNLLWKMVAYNGDELSLPPMGKLCLIVPPTLRTTAETIVEQQFLATGEANKNYRRAELVILPELESHSTTAWYLTVKGDGVPRAIIFQNRQAPEFQSLTDPNSSDHVFKNDEMLYGSKARYNFGYLHPEVIIGSDGSGS